MWSRPSSGGSSCLRCICVEETSELGGNSSQMRESNEGEEAALTSKCDRNSTSSLLEKGTSTPMLPMMVEYTSTSSPEPRCVRWMEVMVSPTWKWMRSSI